MNVFSKCSNAVRRVLQRIWTPRPAPQKAVRAAHGQVVGLQAGRDMRHRAAHGRQGDEIGRQPPIGGGVRR